MNMYVDMDVDVAMYADVKVDVYVYMSIYMYMCTSADVNFVVNMT